MSQSPADLIDAPAMAAVETLMVELAGDELTGRMVREHLATGGKRLRARLALAAVEALGGEVSAAVGWAAACELLHNGTLVHDDVQDGDRLRRGAPTIWARHGIAQAINAGDLLFVLPYLALERVTASDGVRWRLCRALAAHTADVVRGQAAEQAMNEREHVGWRDYEDTVVGKTSALFALPLAGAALLCGRDEALAAACKPLGLLFQMQDDVLDLFGDKQRGVVGSDLYEGKVSSLVVEHVALHPAEAAELHRLLRTPRAETPAEAVAATIERFRSGGALARVGRRIDAAQGEVLAALAGEPALRALVARLIEAVLAPITGALAAARRG